jgi:hypothetical protein
VARTCSRVAAGIFPWRRSAYDTHASDTPAASAICFRVTAGWGLDMVNGFTVQALQANAFLAAGGGAYRHWSVM